MANDPITGLPSLSEAAAENYEKTYGDEAPDTWETTGEYMSTGSRDGVAAQKVEFSKEELDNLPAAKEKAAKKAEKDAQKAADKAAEGGK